jgi:hypothetical protein
VLNTPKLVDGDIVSITDQYAVVPLPAYLVTIRDLVIKGGFITKSNSIVQIDLFSE